MRREAANVLPIIAGIRDSAVGVRHECLGYGFGVRVPVRSVLGVIYSGLDAVRGAHLPKAPPPMRESGVASSVHGKLASLDSVDSPSPVRSCAAQMAAYELSASNFDADFSSGSTGVVKVAIPCNIVMH